MQSLLLKNFTILEKQDIQGRTYYLIKDKETDEGYFCFWGALQKKGWEELSKWYEIKELEIEYEVNERGNNKVVNLSVVREGEVFV